MTDITPHLISADSTLRQALKQLNELSGGSMTLFVTAHGTHKLVGSLTDGDIRRAIIAGCDLDAPVSQAAYATPRTITAGNVDIVDDIRQLRNKGITLLPVIDDAGDIISIINLHKTPTHLPLSAILMAGGKGERLRPLTNNTPKPLLTIEGKAIIDYNIESLAACGIDNIWVTTNYLAEQLDAHFAAPVAGVSVRTVREPLPLGTIGSASLVPLPDTGDTIVMNSDLITSISFEEMYIRHRDTDADITIAVIPYQISVPFAILQLDGDRVTSIEEKPSYTHYANAGIYIIANRLLSSLPTDKRTDATDLVADAIAAGCKVVTHQVNGSWIDVGSPADFAQAKQMMKHHKNFTSPRH